MQELLSECEKAYGKKDYSRLDWLLNQILEEDKTNETALTYKLYVYCDWGQYHLVFRIADKIHRLYPKNFHAYNAEAMAYLDKKEFEKALDCCEEGLTINDYHWLRINKIESLINLNRIDDAFEFYNSSLIPDYNFTKALINCGRYSEIYKIDEGLSKEELMVYFFERCHYLDDKGIHDEIPRVCDEIFKIDEDNEFALEYKIHSLVDDGEVLKCCNHAIRLYPDNFNFHFMKGETLLWAFEDIDGAIECYENGFGLMEDLNEHWFDVDNIITALDKKADQLIESGNYQKAVKAYDKILSYKPSEFEALDNIDRLVDEHDIEHEPSKHYKESLRLRIELENRLKSIDEYLNSIDVGDYDEDYVDGCREFKDYESLSDYVHDILICLMDAYPGHDEEYSRIIVRSEFENVKNSFEYKQSAYDFAVCFGYGCG